MRSRPAAVILASLLLWLVACDIAIAIVATDTAGGDALIGITIGFILCQMTLAAVWSALGPFSVPTRAAQTTIVVAFVSLCFASFLIRNGAPASYVLLFCGIALAVWIAIQLPLWVIRLHSGLHLAFPGTDPDEAPTEGRIQFGIRELLIWTALTAVTLASARVLLTLHSPVGGRADAVEMLAFFLIITTFNTLAAMPVILASLTTRRTPIWLIVAMICCLVIHSAEVTVFEWAPGTSGQSAEPFVWLNATQFVGIAIVLLAMKKVGLRAVQAKPGGWI